MKILFLTVMPSPYQRQLFSKLAKSKDLEVAVRYYTVGAHDREWKSPDFEPHEKAMPGKVLKRLGPSAHWNKSVIDEIEAVDADLVVVSDYSAPTAQRAMRWLARRGRPFVFWGEVPGFSKRGAVGSFIRARLQAPLAKADAIVGIGSRAEKVYQSLFPDLPTYNIPYFCDLTQYRDARSARNKHEPTDAVSVLFSGQLIHRKGADTLIEAFVSIAGEHPNLQLKLLGNGPERDRLISMVPDDLKAKVHFLGHKDPTELPALFADADIFCLPSRHDGWGVVINEALGAGLPIIATDVTGAALDLVIDGENGLIVPADDPSSLAQALRTLADDDRRQVMAVAADEMSVRWGLDEGVKRWLSVATKVLAKETV